MVTNASFHSCINVRVYEGRLPQATTLRYLKPLSRICRQGLPPARRNPSSTTQNQGNLRSVTVAAIQSTSTSMVTNASFHSCINVRVRNCRLPETTTHATHSTRQPQISHCRHNPKHINEYATMHHLIHVWYGCFFFICL